VNYFKDFGEQWWARWQDVMAKPFDPGDCARFATLGIDYIVVKPDHKLPSSVSAFENPRYVAYATKSCPTSPRTDNSVHNTIIPLTH